jgi:hypothetical protein
MIRFWIQVSGGGSASETETAAGRFQKQDLNDRYRYVAVSEVNRETVTYIFMAVVYNI